MTISAEDRQVLAKTFEDVMPTIAAMVHTYAGKADAPERFGIGLYDASDGGENYAAGGEPADRTIAEHRITVADWGERNFLETAQRKVRGALRLGKNSGDILRTDKDLFREGEAPNPGACLADVGGHQVCVATSGLRGTEDEPFALLVIELMKRLTPTP